jgi:outer membrane protein TolC
MRIKNVLLGLAGLSVPLLLQAQEKKDSVLHFSLAEAKAYAQANSPVIKNSTLDLESAKKKIWETTAIGLPQVSGKLAYSYMITIPALYKEFIPPTTNINDIKWSSTLDLNVNQLIFSGSYIVGLQTAKIYKGLSELSLTKSKNDLDESVTNAYLLVLVANENKLLLDSTYQNTEQILNDMKKMLQQGMIDETDVEQLQLTTNTLKNSADLMHRQSEIAERMLKFQLGADLDSKIILTDSIHGLINDFNNNINLASQNFILENNIDYKLLDTQAKLMKMNLLLNKSAFLPEISSYYQHENLLNKTAISLNPPDVVGISLSIPLFTSGQRLARISQAKYSYQKALFTKQQMADGLKLSFNEEQSSYVSSVDKYNTSKENLALAEKIYNRTLLKYKQGMVSSIELTQTQNQYIQNQSNYYSSILDMVSAKEKLEKILIQAK